MIALLLRREVFTPYFRGATGGLTVPTEPRDVWLGLLLNDAANTPIGYINFQTEPSTRDRESGMNTRVAGRMRLNFGSFQGDLAVNGRAWFSSEAGLRDFSFTLRSGEHATTLSGTLADGKVTGEIDTGGEKTPINMTAASLQMLASPPGMGLSMPSLEVGDEVFLETLDPLTMSSGKARVRCVGEETITVMGRRKKTKVFQTDLSGIKSKAWVDEHGEVLRAETPIGFVLQRMEAGEAIKLAVGKGQSAAGLLEFAAIKPTGLPPFRGATRMQLEISGLEGIAQLPADGSQSPGPRGTLDIAPRGPVGPAQALSREERDRALANDSFLQTTHPKIVAKAREIAGEETDPWKQASLIYEWVYSSIRKDLVPSLPTALDVLNTMEGDCNEHTMLYTALARALGLPTRMAIGLVWSEDHRAFYYHAWPEVYAGRWVWMDPTLGQPVADATHIKLISGDLMSWWRIAPFMGNIRIRVLNVE